MEKMLILWPLVVVLTQTAEIIVTPISSGTLKNAPINDTCKKLIAHRKQIFHLSSDGQYESWNPSELENSVENRTVSTYQVYNMEVSSEDSYVVFTHDNLSSPSIHFYVFDYTYFLINASRTR